MRHVTLALEDQAVSLHYPESLHDEISILLPNCRRRKRRGRRNIAVRQDGRRGAYSLHSDGAARAHGLAKSDCLYLLLGEIVHELITDLGTGVALHAGAVSLNDSAVLIPGTSGSGKSCLTAWLAGNGFSYLTDELTVLSPDVPNITAFARPLIIKEGAGISASRLEELTGAGSVIDGINLMHMPENSAKGDVVRQCRLILLPSFREGSDLSIEPLTAAQAGLELMACNVNARNLANHGFDIVTGIACEVPAVRLRYGDFSQLDGTLDTLLKIAVDDVCGAHEFRRLFSAFATPVMVATESENAFPPRPAKLSTVPEATPRGRPRKLTIGMCTYDDYDGVYFTLQSLRMYHSDVVDDAELLVVDNNPAGPCAEALKALEYSIPNYRYVPFQEWTGTTVKEVVFREAAGEYVMCMDCHVFVVPGALRKLVDYFDENPDTSDLLQGPLIYDDLTTFATHFEPRWREGMYGTWEEDERGKESDSAPFEIPMQGMGLSACRKAAWPGFNPEFRGFGAEEFYIHEKIRQAGGRALCLPFLRWMHRFNRPMGVPYQNSWNDRIRNYLIGFSELGLDIEPVEDHFMEFLGPAVASPIIEAIKRELAAEHV